MGCGNGGRCVCGGFVPVYTDICGSLSPTRSMSCVLPLLEVNNKPDATQRPVTYTLVSTEENERSHEPR